MIFSKPAIVFSWASLIILGASCSSTYRTEKPEALTAILGAFDKEVDLIESELAAAKGQEIEGIKFVTGCLAGRKVVVVWTGIGKVNAAMTTTLLLEHFRPKEVIFTGIAGGMNPDLNPGDIVIAVKSAQHDSGILRSDGMEYRGMINRLDGWRNPVFFLADERLLGAAEKAVARVKFGTIKTSIGQRIPRIVKGVIVTGDLFVASPAKSAELREALKADAVEMEGAAVAQICYQRQVPHLIIRSISDKADEKAREESDYFEEMAAENSARFIKEIVGILGADCLVQTPAKGNQ
jgi:adenosylhomocysteine nucleosidase